MNFSKAVMMAQEKEYAGQSVQRMTSAKDKLEIRG